MPVAQIYSPQVRAAAIRVMLGNIPNITLGVSLMVAVMVWVMWGEVATSLLLAWAALVLLVAAVEMWMHAKFVRAKLSDAETLKWARYYTLTSVLNGAAWGCASFLFFVPDSAVLQVFLFTCMVGMATSSIIQHAYWLESYYAFAVPLLALSGLRILLEGGGAYHGLAVLTLLLLVIAILMARDAEKSALSAIHLGFENADLIEQLRAEKENAEHTSRDKTRFLAAASHDLRQPVHALTLFAEALQPEVQSERGSKLLANVGRSIDSINQLLSSLLDLSRLDANIIKANPADIALGKLLSQLDAEYFPQAVAKGLQWKMVATDLHVHTDIALLEMILRNLISNALRYTSQGGITISAIQKANEVYIEIADTGCGIPADKQQDIFREFYQLENPARDRTKGLGLGLAIVDRVARLLHHRIELESAPGQGARFSVVAPLGAAPAGTGGEAISETIQHELEGMKVLVIDDDRDVRESMQAVMRNWGCEVMLAANTVEALTLLRGQGLPQAVITDYRLSANENGLSVLRQLLYAFGMTIPALVMTGDTAPERLREVQASGFGLMHKPVQPAKLRAWLRNIQRKHQQGEKIATPDSTRAPVQ